jgi:mono/diheme cytochrome c family protein
MPLLANTSSNTPGPGEVSPGAGGFLDDIRCDSEKEAEKRALLTGTGLALCHGMSSRPRTERFNPVRWPWPIRQAALLLTLAAAVVARQPAQAESLTPSGEELYRTYCASCHGVNATGNGPMARYMRHAPPDLTQLAKKNGGMFPAARVHRIVEGRDVESHGDRDMPVWGDAFKTAGDRSGPAAEARINAIVQYLSSIQQQQAH